jgi:very-short-patch-repair endonuclease
MTSSIPELGQSLLDRFPALSREWHPTKNGDLKPENFTKGSGKKVWWLCEKKCKVGCLHEWLAAIGDRTKYGCPYCSPNRIQLCVHDSIVGTHPNIVKQWHPNKNGDLNPEKYGFGSHKKVWWICENKCKEGCLHEWESVISSRCNGVECPFCCKPQKQNCIHDSIIYTHPDIANQWHPVKNIKYKIENITSGVGKKVWWKCNKENCHEWECIIQNRTKGNGCPFCACQKICKKEDCISCKNKSFASSEKAQYWSHKNLVQPYEVFISSKEKYWFNCDNHEFSASLNNISTGYWCPYCINKTEQKLYDILITHYPQLKQQFKVEWCKNKTYLPFDFVLEDYKIIIELDGLQHFKQVSNWTSPEDTHINDVYKMKCANDNGYSIIRLLQEDVFYDTYDWLVEIKTNIEKVKTEQRIQNCYMCKNNEYELFNT